MRKIKFGKTIITTTAALGLVAFNPALSANEHEKGEKSAKHEAHASKQSPEHFIKEALEANQLEIRAAQLAQRQGENPQVKQLASTIVQHHRDLQQQLQQFAEQHKVQARTETQQLTGKHQEQWSKLEGKTGQELDKAFVTFVVKDHKKDLTMLEKCSKEFTSAPELKAFIDRNIPVIRQHLQMAQQTAQALKIDPATLVADTEEGESAAGAPAAGEKGIGERETRQSQESDQQKNNEADVEIEADADLKPDNNEQP